MKKEEKEIFEASNTTNNIFLNKETLLPYHIPETLPHRAKEIDTLANALGGIVCNETPPNVFIYGKKGIGKTTVVKYVAKKVLRKSKQDGKAVCFIYLNCEIVDTTCRIGQNIANHFITSWEKRVPFAGWSTEKNYSRLYELLKQTEETQQTIIIIFDEILKAKEYGFLDRLTEIKNKLDNTKLSFITISDDLKFTEFLDSEMKHNIEQKTIFFSPNKENEIRDILKERIRIGLKQNAISDRAFSLIVQTVVNEHGDIDKGLELLVDAGKRACLEKSDTIKVKHVGNAQHNIEVSNNFLERNKMR
jgi:cell division control protein 6